MAYLSLQGSEKWPYFEDLQPNQRLHGITHNTLLSSFYWIAQTSSNFGQHYLDMKNWLGDLGQSEKENILDK